MTARTVLELRSASLVTRSKRLFDAVSVTLTRGDRVAIVAESGEGKSQLLRLAMGLVAPLGGSVELFGQNLAICGAEERRRLRRRCGSVFQGGSLISGLTVDDNLWLGLSAPAAARARLQRKLDRVSLDFEIEHLGGSLVDILSTGERRRVELARALLHDPELVLLDEPFAGVQASAEALERQVRRYVVARGRALLLLTQDAAQAARLCDRIYRLAQGRLIALDAGQQGPAPDAGTGAALS